MSLHNCTSHAFLWFIIVTGNNENKYITVKHRKTYSKADILLKFSFPRRVGFLSIKFLTNLKLLTLEFLSIKNNDLFL